VKHAIGRQHPITHLSEAHSRKLDRPILKPRSIGSFSLLPLTDPNLY